MSEEQDFEEWSRRFAAATPLRRAALLGGTAVRLGTRLIERSIDSAAQTYLEAERAFKRELDPNMEDAKILEERDHPSKGSDSL